MSAQFRRAILLRNSAAQFGAILLSRLLLLSASTDDAVLGEFGSAGSGAAAMTRVAGVPYEMRYASPAIAEGAEARTESDEAWALGVCVYELLALR